MTGVREDRQLLIPTMPQPNPYLRPVAGFRPSAWSSTAATKFRVPRRRTSWVDRPGLLARLTALSAEHRVTLVCAPAGSGKSTLLAQLAAAPPAAAETVWLALDEDDNDPNRLYVSLVRALEQVPLEWPADPQLLAAQAGDGGSGARAAVAGLVNALCAYPGERLLLIADDLHRIGDADALGLLDDLIDRLPSEVGVVIGTRVAPALSLARWRARDELGELGVGDLQFGEAEALAFAAVRLEGAVSADFVRQALARTQGWAAGLQLLFGAAAGHPAPVSAPTAGKADRHLFDYFAAEVLRGLPSDLREFLLCCAILPELDPLRCAAVSGRDDARGLLEELYRRNLFLTVMDDTAPLLRLHDLFRDYLREELAKHHASSVAELHARAAAAEPVAPRAVTHWLKAGRWDEAIVAIGRCAEPLLAEGGYALIERWIQQLPGEIRRQHPEVANLQGLCRWARYDFPGMREPLARACDGYRRRGDTRRLAPALFTLTRSHFSGTGDLEACTRLLDEADGLELDAGLRAAFHSVRAWLALADGRPDDIAPALRAMLEIAEGEPNTLYPAIGDVFNGFFHGLPGTLAPLRGLRALCGDLAGRQAVHWQVEAMVQSAWPEFWHGERAAAQAALDRQWRFHQRMASLPALWLDLHQLTGFILAAGGEFARAEAMERRNLEITDTAMFAPMAAGWRRFVVLNLACVLWVAQDAGGLAALLPLLEPARRREEWPAIDTGRALVAGQHALLSGRLAEAETALLRACDLDRRWRLPGFMPCPDVSLALLRLAQGNAPAAWAAFKPVLRRAAEEDCIGPLLMQPREPLARLLALIPPGERQDYRAILERLAGWETKVPAQGSGSDAGLSEREREVLARVAAGDSNKEIARALDLSPHTVKRHVANILDKLGAASRGQAAAWWRDHQQGGGLN